ncbi:MAG TPA: DUF2306 domain-containing protein [Terriglobales bacterium]|nr:DUF2306 domain-containing protein [Terriglobales bacterium]
MSTAPAVLQRNPWLLGKYFLAAFIGLMFAYVLVHNESFLINAKDPEWQHIHPFRWYLLPHALAGACALLLAPMQFSDRLRRRFAKLHRVVGRIYVGGVLIAAPFGFYIQYFAERSGAPRSFSVAAAAQATTWIVTTVIALAFILQGKVEQHRRWMTRSFSVALVFLEVRLVLGVTGWEQLGHSAAETVVWSCNIFALLAADLVLQWQELRRSHPVPKRQKASL